MSHSLQGRRALVTASSQGLGFAIARRLAVAGCAVAINARDPVRLREAAEKIGNETVALTADLAVPAQVEGLAADAIAALGGLDLLVVNSGHIPYGTLEDLPDESWYGAFDLLLMSAVRLCRAVAPALRVAGGGNIVFIGSATVRQPSPHLLLSSVMRLGVTGLAKTLAREWASDGIRVNVVAPGYFGTGRVRARIAEQVAGGATPEDAMRTVAGSIPMQRVGEPEELAELVAFLAEGRAGFLTGAHMILDGGADTFPL
jgi:3-oxoacyl-[acyl-carrier protein] reductase